MANSIGAKLAQRAIEEKHAQAKKTEARIQEEQAKSELLNENVAFLSATLSPHVDDFNCRHRSIGDSKFELVQEESTVFHIQPRL